MNVKNWKLITGKIKNIKYFLKNDYYSVVFFTGILINDIEFSEVRKFENEG